MEKDMAGTRAAITTILLAIPFSIGSFAFAAIGLSPAGFLLGVVGLFSLPRLMPLVRVPTEGFARKDWISHAGTMFLSWLAFWILLMNPPFSDFTPPEISLIVVNGAWVTGPLVSVNNTWTGTTINVTVSDNVGVRAATITVGSANATALDTLSPGAYQWLQMGDVLSATRVCVDAEDVNGHAAERCFTMVPA